MRLLVIIVMFFCVFSAQAQLTLQLDSSSIQMGETLRLSLTLTDIQNRHSPNLSALKDNFTIVGTERTVNYTVINGQAHSLNQWIILLIPKRIGVLTIPPIQVGQEETQAMQIEVGEEKTTPQSDEKNAAVKLVTEVSESAPYVNQQVIYTVKLYNSKRLLDVDYVPPKLKDALMVSLGEAKRYQVMDDGIPYTVEELQYAFFPQKSGDLKVIPPEFRALVFDAMPGKIYLKGKESVIKVKPAPMQDDKAPWLPAKQVILAETYDNDAKDMLQGNMVVRTVTLKTVGVAAQLLPKLSFKTNHQFSIYPEKPIEETRYQDPDLIGRVTVKISYLLNKPGTVVIPELKLPWFNLVSGKMAMASLPARTIQIAAVSTSIAPSSTIPMVSKASKSIEKPLETESKSISSSHKYMVQSHLPWILVAIFAVAWLLTLFLWWWSRFSCVGHLQKRARQRLKRACLDNDPIAVKEALLLWAQYQWPDGHCSTLGDVEKKVSSQELKRAINSLTQSLYGQQKQQWLGKELWFSFLKNQIVKKKSEKQKKSLLPSINP